MVFLHQWKQLVLWKWTFKMVCAGRKNGFSEMSHFFKNFSWVVIAIASRHHIFYYHIERYSVLKATKPALLVGVDFFLPWQSLPLRNHGDLEGVYAHNDLQNVILACFVMSLLLCFHGNSSQGNVLGMKNHGGALLLVWAIAPQLIPEARNGVLEYA